MKKLLLLFFSLLAFEYMFQTCNNSETYAEMLDEGKDVVNVFIKKHDICTISESDFEVNGYKTDTTKNEYIAFSNGVCVQIADKGIVTDKPENGSIKNNNTVAVRLVEHDIKANDTTHFNVVLPGFEDYLSYYAYPDILRYMGNGTSVAGIFTGRSTYAKYGTTDVPPGWLLTLKYVTNYAHMGVIIPSKMGRQSANQYVNSYFYSIRKFQRALSQNY